MANTSPNKVTVSCLLVTSDRRELLKQSLECYAKQLIPDSWEIELITIDNGKDSIRDLIAPWSGVYTHIPEKMNHGQLMNEAFKAATGEFAIVWDDDDLYAPNRIEKQVNAVISSGRDAAGTGKLIYFYDRNKRAWLYDNSRVLSYSPTLRWIGAPAYRMAAYHKHGSWENLKCGADYKFLKKISFHDMQDTSLMLCRIHDGNAAGKDTSNPAWSEIDYNSLAAGWSLNLFPHLNVAPAGRP